MSQGAEDACANVNGRGNLTGRRRAEGNKGTNGKQKFRGRPWQAADAVISTFGAVRGQRRRRRITQVSEAAVIAETKSACFKTLQIHDKTYDGSETGRVKTEGFNKASTSILPVSSNKIIGCVDTLPQRTFGKPGKLQSAFSCGMFYRRKLPCMSLA